MTGTRALRIAAGLGVGVWAALALRSFLAPGLPIEVDAASHLARSGFVAQALREARLPWWSFDWYAGFRLLEFYGPAYYTLVGSIAAALGDAVRATKLVLFLGQVATALVLYACGRRLDLSPLAAAVWAVLFVESPQRGWALGGLGNHPSVLVYAGAAAYLWLAARPAPADAPLAPLAARRALLLAGMLAAHLQALLLLPGLLAFDAVRLAPLGTRRAFAVAASSLAGMAALTACIWLPLALDVSLVSLSLDAGLRAFDLELDPLRIALGMAPTNLDYVFVRPDGRLWLALALASAAASVVVRDARGLALGAGLVASGACVLAFGERAVLALSLFVWPLAALAPALVAGRLPARLARATEAAGCLAALAVLGLAGAPREPAQYADASAFDVYTTLPPTPTHSRSFDITQNWLLSLDGFYGASAAAPLWSQRPVPLGGFPQGAPLATNLTLAGLGRLSFETEPKDKTLDVLYLTHVGFLVDRGPEPRVVRLAQASPAVFAPRLETLPAKLAPPAAAGELRLLAALRERWHEDPLGGIRRDPSLAPLRRTAEKRDFELVVPAITAMQIDRDRAVAARIFVDGPAPAPLGAPPAAAALRLDVLAHREAAGAVELEVHAPAAGWLRLAYAHDPALEVRIDARDAECVSDSLGAAVVAIPAGRHRISLRAPAPAGWIALAAGCGAAAVAAAWLALAPRGRHLTGAAGAW